MTEIDPREVPGDPLALHWVVRTGSQDVVGEVAAAPGPLGALLEDRVVSLALLETEGIWTWLAPGNTWADRTDEVREAIGESLELDGWQIRDDSADLLRLIANDVIDNDLADFIEAADTTVEVIENDAHWLLLDLGRVDARGPAASDELQLRIEVAIRARYPILREVSRVGGPESGQVGLANAPRRALWTDG
ncbi:hypothetical protein [[Pseudopropionibacterium] massiliense]|uniref:hypothetical protein n=1 Tax=[Pseudopropionibacterium] massiliense TaxID=2220000 RepID=UPI00102F4352|nr:hypothetical protein [[Pseudopropionibacterium] massiliense]